MQVNNLIFYLINKQSNLSNKKNSQITQIFRFNLDPRHLRAILTTYWLLK